MNAGPALGASYRLQFNRDFTVDDAVAILPYLRALGITHLYASPLLKARAGSPHGYDIVDHGRLNPEIGDDAAFERFFDALAAQGLGLILDIVPNHMGVGGDDNRWWLDVLEHGEASAFEGYFDIDWRPVNATLRGKVLAPVLGDHYGAVLEAGELKLGFDAATGAFHVRYYAHLFPLDPRTAPVVLSHGLEALARHPADGPDAAAELAALTEAFRSLPRRTERSHARRRRRRRDAANCKEALATLWRTRPAVRDHVEAAVARFNGTPGEPASFDRLHRLLETQAYRLAHWVVAADDINYRRFFDINDLAGVRMENPEVFEATHRLIAELIGAGRVHGLRIDHPDGLADPHGYYNDLVRLVERTRPPAVGPDQAALPIYVEKILASYERLPADWPVAGTTGYEAAHQLNGVLVYGPSERALTQLHARFTGRVDDFDELLYGCKKLITRRTLASELTVLASLATTIARADRRTRDLTYHGLRDAIAELAACFPVYRTYLTPGRAASEDLRYVEWALAQAKKRDPGRNPQSLEFVAELLTLRGLEGHSLRVRRQATQFTLRFQQYSAPVMAKGLEDTAMYRYHRLISLNDVGFDPRSYGLTRRAFHHANQQRAEQWPRAMVCTSTHDSKRSEDVRARINVLSELPGEWRQRLRRWSRLNRGKKRRIDDRLAPTRADEYLLYQTLVGAWPLAAVDADGLGELRERVEAFMIKAVREGKLHSTWINPDEDYEDAVRHFVRALLSDPERSPFLVDFLPFQRRIARFGLLNGVSQTLLKLTVPGVPDLYQGNEVWQFSLVDPDNRRPVEYPALRASLEHLMDAVGQARVPAAVAASLLEHLDDGRAKQYVTWRALTLRGERPSLFLEGDYAAVDVRGPRAEHVCAYTRSHGDQEVLVAVARWYARLAGEEDAAPVGMTWADTRLSLPATAAGCRYRNLLDGAVTEARPGDDGAELEATEVFGHFPVALLLRE